MLDMEKDHYAMWARLFQTHAWATKVLHHIIPQPWTERPTPTYMLIMNNGPFLILLYFSGSTLPPLFDLLTTTMEKGSTVMSLAWITFQIFLHTINNSNLSLIGWWMLVFVNSHHLVLQLVFGLFKPFHGVATLICRATIWLPSFMLVLCWFSRNLV